MRPRETEKLPVNFPVISPVQSKIDDLDGASGESLESNERSGADKLRVQASSHRWIGGSLDNGAAIAEQRHFVGLPPELQDHVVVANLAMGRQARAHFRKIYWAIGFVDLNRIAPT